MKTLIIAVLFFLINTAYAGDVTLTLSPDQTIQADGFEVLWVSSDGSTGRQLLSVDELVWIHADLDPGQSITYEAYAYNTAGYSPPSAQVTATLNPIVVPPTNTLPIPVYIAPVGPVEPGMTFTCSGNISCEVN